MAWKTPCCDGASGLFSSAIAGTKQGKDEKLHKRMEHFTCLCNSSSLPLLGPAIIQDEEKPWQLIVADEAPAPSGMLVENQEPIKGGRRIANMNIGTKEIYQWRETCAAMKKELNW